jgi:hypothetical protein
VKGKTDLRAGKSDLVFLNDKSYQGYMGALGAVSSGKINTTDVPVLIDSMVTSINSDKSAPVVASRAGQLLILIAKSTSIKFDAQIDPKYGSLVSGGLSGSGADGSTAVATAVLTSAGLSATASALIGHQVIITKASSSNYGLKVAITANTGTTITQASNFGYLESTLDFVVIGGVSKYPSLTLADVQKAFPVTALKAGQDTAQFPSSSVTAWTKWAFRIERAGAYALDGANHLDSYIEEFEIFVPTSVAQTATIGEKKIFDWLTACVSAGLYVDPEGVASPWGLATS